MNAPVPPPASDRLDWIDAELVALENRDLLRRSVVAEAHPDGPFAIDGQPLINFGSNDYLGLVADPRLAAAAAEAVAEAGWGSGASPLVTGRTLWHARLEQRLAQFEGTEAAILFPTGYAANTGTIPTLAGEGDAIFGDAKNHASIIDGCRLARAPTHVYRHGDCQHLASLLEGAGSFCRRLIVTDSLFSMDGDLAPLNELARLARRFDAMLMVDEAHATGVFGLRGRGVAESMGVEHEIDVRVGTLCKALGSSGG
ncbi:MAG: aminotransferase class I/II-fold pyridoxal phosphate-dependent enzyme, partial [Pirellulales bacterium]